jgi:hypothetical protein
VLHRFLLLHVRKTSLTHLFSRQVLLTVVSLNHRVSIDYSIDSFQAATHPIIERWFALIGAEREWGDVISQLPSAASLFSRSVETSIHFDPAASVQPSTPIVITSGEDNLTPDPLSNVTVTERQRSAGWPVFLVRHNHFGLKNCYELTLTFWKPGFSPIRPRKHFGGRAYSIHSRDNNADSGCPCTMHLSFKSYQRDGLR